MTHTEHPNQDTDCGPFPTALEMLEQQCALLATELDDTNAELRACRQRIAVLVVQHGNDANEIARQRTELVRLGWELSTARVGASREEPSPASCGFDELCQSAGE